MSGSSTNPEHYSRWKIQPWDFISQNNLDFMRGNVIKYLMRYDAKNCLEDLKKAREYLDKLININFPEAFASYPHQDAISKIWTVSTGNITKEDNDILMRYAFRADTGKGNRFIFSTDAGFLLPVDSVVCIRHQLPKGLTEYAFYKLYKAALSLDVSWLDLDRDADPAPGFEIFEW